MAESLKISAREGDTEHRCPYCHDLLQGEDDPRVECEGCGTQHHLACLTELGRCTVMGCDRPIDAEALPARPPATSRVQRLIRQRQRERARQFVRRNVNAPQEPARNPRYVPREGGWYAPENPVRRSRLFGRGSRGSLLKDNTVVLLLALGACTILLAVLAMILAQVL